MTTIKIRNLENIYVCICIILLSGGLYLAFSEGGGRATDSSDTVAQFVRVPGYLYALYCLFLFPRKVISAARGVPLLMLILGLCFLSTQWSIAPDDTLRRSVLLALTMLFALGLSVRYRRDELFKMLAMSFIAIVFLMLLAAFINPQVAIHQDQHYPAVRGFFAQKNIAGRTLLVGFLVGLLLYLQPATKKLAVWTIASCFLGITLTLSMTAMLSAVALSITFWLAGRIQRNKGSSLILGLFTFAFLALLYAYGIVQDLVIESIESTGRNITLTGRTIIWQVLIWELTENAYWLGFGYEAFWTSPQGALGTEWGLGPYIPPHAHNGILQTWASIGLVGVILLISALVSFLYKGFRQLYRYNDPMRRASLIFFVYIFLTNVSESSFLVYGNLIWIMFVFIYATVPADRARVGYGK